MVQIIFQLNKILNQWLFENGFDCHVKFDDDFGYDYMNGIINYTLYEDLEEESNQLFIDICKSIYNTDYDPFIISFLHELGHHITRDYMTQKDIAEQVSMQETFCGESEEQLQHMVSFIEWEATNWACNYIKNNQESVKQLYEMTEQSRVDFFNQLIITAKNTPPSTK